MISCSQEDHDKWVRYRRGIACSSCCEDCPFVEETIAHTLRDCNHMRRIWRQLVNDDQWTEFMSGEVDDWIRRNLQGQFNGSSDHLRPSVFGVAVWKI